MRICDLTTLHIEGGAGGVNTYLHEKARFLSELRGPVEHLMIVPSARTARRRIFRSRVHALTSPRLPSNPQHRVLVRFGSVKRILRDFAPDIVEVDCAYFLGRPARAALEGRRSTLVGFYHVHLPLLFRLGAPLGRWTGRLAEEFAWRYFAFCARPLARILVPNQEVLAQLQERGFRNLEHLPLGVNLELFRPPVDARARNGTGRTILYVGRLSEEKDVRLLLEAYSRLAVTEPELKLVVAGDGPLRPLVERAARTQQGLSYLGLCPYGPELARLYGAADVLAVPGRCETFGLAVVEALACGLPVVATRRGGPQEVVTPEVGALARPGDVVDLAEKLAAVLARGPDGRRARLHVESHYSWERTFQRLLEIYSSASGLPAPLLGRARRRQKPLEAASVVP